MISLITDPLRSHVFNALLINLGIIIAILVGFSLGHFETALLLIALREVYAPELVETTQTTRPAGEYESSGQFGFMSDDSVGED